MFLHRICNKAEQCNMADCPVLNYKFQRARHTDRNVVTYMTFVIIKLRLIDPPEVQVNVTGHRAIALFFQLTVQFLHICHQRVQAGHSYPSLLPHCAVSSL